VKKVGPQAALFDVYEDDEGATFEVGSRSKLIWGDTSKRGASTLDSPAIS
jgi:hypothetical protein